MTLGENVTGGVCVEPEEILLSSCETFLFRIDTGTEAVGISIGAVSSFFFKIDDDLCL